MFQLVAGGLSELSPVVILPRSYCYGEHHKDGALKTVSAVSVVAGCAC